MVVEVDDSGWGDLVGGAVIVMRRVGTNERYVGEVPIETFQGQVFKAKAYLPHVLRIVREGAEALSIDKDEPVHVCTGYILSEVRKALTNEGYRVVPSRIVGATQEYAEEEYIKHLSRIGVGTPDQAKRLRGFNNSLAWVLRDVDKRERLVKTGWKAWPRLKSGEDVDPKQTKE
ncbi:MAG: hypothetical protein NTV61_11070 [Candidatus Bathyarchaeota archaeon]|nr:hypothetical protein [Candidatus Bathyarchaeota archaeon]